MVAALDPVAGRGSRYAVLIATAASTSPKALWYLTRGTGLVALVLLTITMTLGLAQPGRFVKPGLARLIVAALHRNASLIAVGLLTVHIATAVADSYVPIKLVDAFVPFVSAYRPIWLGLGALALDLLIVLIATSLIRAHMGASAWRRIHWAAYACWPLAVVHGLGTGSDSRLGWTQALYVACAAAVLVSLWWRVATTWNPAKAGERILVVAVSVFAAIAVLAWALQGPLRPGWAKRSQAASSLLAHSETSTAVGNFEGSPIVAGPSPSRPLSAIERKAPR